VPAKTASSYRHPGRIQEGEGVKEKGEMESCVGHSCQMWEIKEQHDWYSSERKKRIEREKD
jgi:hypothetical protein